MSVGDTLEKVQIMEKPVKKISEETNDFQFSYDQELSEETIVHRAAEIFYKRMNMTVNQKENYFLYDKTTQAMTEFIDPSLYKLFTWMTDGNLECWFSALPLPYWGYKSSCTWRKPEYLATTTAHKPQVIGNLFTWKLGNFCLKASRRIGAKALTA